MRGVVPGIGPDDDVLVSQESAGEFRRWMERSV